MKLARLFLWISLVGVTTATQVTRNLQHDGRERSYILFTPASLPSGPVPLVLDLHGGDHGSGTAASGQKYLSGFDTLAASEGFVVAYPAGISGGWNTGVPGCEVYGGVTDDVGFLRRVITDASSQQNIDASRVYITGYSCGCMMANRFAVNASDVTSAMACFAGFLTQPGESYDSKPGDRNAAVPIPLDPVPAYTATNIMLIVGDDDTITQGTAQPTIDAFVALNECTGGYTETWRTGSHYQNTYERCAGGTEVALVSIHGVGHLPYVRNGCLDTPRMAWDFFSSSTSSAHSAVTPAECTTSSQSDNDKEDGGWGDKEGEWGSNDDNNGQDGWGDKEEVEWGSKDDNNGQDGWGDKEEVEWGGKEEAEWGSKDEAEWGSKEDGNSDDGASGKEEGGWSSKDDDSSEDGAGEKEKGEWGSKEEGEWGSKEEDEWGGKEEGEWGSKDEGDSDDGSDEKGEGEWGSKEEGDSNDGSDEKEEGEWGSKEEDEWGSKDEGDSDDGSDEKEEGGSGSLGDDGKQEAELDLGSKDDDNIQDGAQSPPARPSPPPPCPSPSLPAPPIDTPTASLRFTTTFASLDISSFADASFSGAFHQAYRSQVALSASLPVTAVSIDSVTSGSTSIATSVRFPTPTSATAFVNTHLGTADPANMFASDASFQAYGAVSVARIHLNGQAATPTLAPPTSPTAAIGWRPVLGGSDGETATTTTTSPSPMDDTSAVNSIASDFDGTPPAPAAGHDTTLLAMACAGGALACVLFACVAGGVYLRKTRVPSELPFEKGAETSRKPDAPHVVVVSAPGLDLESGDRRLGPRSLPQHLRQHAAMGPVAESVIAMPVASGAYELATMPPQSSRGWGPGATVHPRCDEVVVAAEGVWDPVEPFRVPIEGSVPIEAREEPLGGATMSLKPPTPPKTAW